MPCLTGHVQGCVAVEINLDNVTLRKIERHLCDLKMNEETLKCLQMCETNIYIYKYVKLASYRVNGLLGLFLQELLDLGQITRLL